MNMLRSIPKHKFCGLNFRWLRHISHIPDSHVVSRQDIVFFDLETTYPRTCVWDRRIVEFGAIVFCLKTLASLESYSFTIHADGYLPARLVTQLKNDYTNVWPVSKSVEFSKVKSVEFSKVKSVAFSEVADKIYKILNGKIWVGHNIIHFDAMLLKNEFNLISRPPPEPLEMIDSLHVLLERFGQRAGNLKLASLANYFGLEKQLHRALPDAVLNLQVMKRSSMVILLEKYLSSNVSNATKESFPGYIFLHEVSMPDVTIADASVVRGFYRAQILHLDIPLLLCCSSLNVQDIVERVDGLGRPMLHFLLGATPDLCCLLDACDDVAFKRHTESGSKANWIAVVIRKSGFLSSPTIKLRSEGMLQIYQREWSTTTLLPNMEHSIANLTALIHKGSIVDVYFSLYMYYYKEKGGISLVANKLIVDCR